MSEPVRVASGVSQLDRLLGGVFIGDNVVWYDDAGSLAAVFCHNFILASQSQNKPMIYVTFDRSPKNLLDKLGELANYPNLTVLDCFTHGKGKGSDVFLRFYEEDPEDRPDCRIIPLDDPRDTEKVSDILYRLHAEHTDYVHFVFESLTGMQELWGGEEEILNFYAHTCPRLYELRTIAYWIMEKEAHTSLLRAQIAQIAQVVIELSIKRGTTSLTVLKAENRGLEGLHKPHNYWTRDLNVVFDDQRRTNGLMDLGLRLRELRNKKGLSQTELAKLVGVTPSTISQVESNHIFPSLPALLKMAEVLGVDISSFFRNGGDDKEKVVFPGEEAVEVRLGDLPDKAVTAHLLTPMDRDGKAEPYLVEIGPRKSLPSHFFLHKGEEMGYLLAGRLQFKVNKAVYTVRAGDVVYLSSDMPTNWTNPGRTPARLLWMKIK